MPIQVVSLEKEASGILLLVKGLRNYSTPAGRLPWGVLERIIAMGASKRDLISASHVCRRWRDILTSSPHLWTEFQCKNAALTLQHLTRSEPAPVNVIADSRADVRAVTGLRSATDRIRSLTLRLRPFDLLEVFGELVTPAPALEHLEVSIIPESGDGPTFRPSIPQTFLGGSAPTLKSLHLDEINTRLQFSEFPALTRLTLVTNTRIFDISELFQLLTSAQLLEELSVQFSGPTTPIPGSQGVVQLPRMRKASFSNTTGEFPTRLLSFLGMPSVEEIKLHINLFGEDKRTMRDFLPPQHRNSPHLSKADNLELDFTSPSCKVKFSGPGVVVSIQVSRGDNRGQDDLFRSRWLNSLEPISVAGVKGLTLRSYYPTKSFCQLPVLELMDGVQSLVVERCSSSAVIEALSPPKRGSVLFPHLESLTLRPATGSATVFPHLTDMARARAQEGFPLSKVSLDQCITFPRSDIDSLKRHVSCVQLKTRVNPHSRKPVEAPSRAIATVRIPFVSPSSCRSFTPLF